VGSGREEIAKKLLWMQYSEFFAKKNLKSPLLIQVENTNFFKTGNLFEKFLFFHLLATFSPVTAVAARFEPWNSGFLVNGSTNNATAAAISVLFIFYYFYPAPVADPGL
jgi:hypothetical protein